jgi:F-type H+-transporting ATPase subunit b
MLWHTIAESLALLVESAEEAEGAAEHHGFNMFEYFSTLTNFLIMVVFLVYVLRRPLILFLESRRENMAKALREAKQKQEEAERRLLEYGSKLEHLEDEVSRIVGSYQKEAEADRVQIRDDADRAIERLARETEFTIKQEIRKAEKAIRESAIQATLEAAEEIIRARITEADQRRLADSYINTLGPSPTPRSRSVLE